MVKKIYDFDDTFFAEIIVRRFFIILFPSVLIIFSSFSLCYSANAKLYDPLEEGVYRVYDLYNFIEEVRIEKCIETDNVFGCYFSKTIYEKGKTKQSGFRYGYVVSDIGSDIVITHVTNVFTGDLVKNKTYDTILKSPIVKGMKWKNTNDKHSYSSNKITNIYKKYKVLAGEFDDVIEITSISSRKGANTKTVSYYAANIGLIKGVLIEKGKQRVFRELIEYASPSYSNEESAAKEAAANAAILKARLERKRENEEKMAKEAKERERIAAEKAD